MVILEVLQTKNLKNHCPVLMTSLFEQKTVLKGEIYDKEVTLDSFKTNSSNTFSTFIFANAKMHHLGGHFVSYRCT